jgi:hypothetical protein
VRHLDARVGYHRRSVIHRDGRGIDFEVAAAVVEFHDHGDGVADVAVARHAQVEVALCAAGGLLCLAVDLPLDGDENRIAIRVAHLPDCEPQVIFGARRRVAAGIGKVFQAEGTRRGQAVVVVDVPVNGSGSLDGFAGAEVLLMQANGGRKSHGRIGLIDEIVAECPGDGSGLRVNAQPIGQVVGAEVIGSGATAAHDRERWNKLHGVRFPHIRFLVEHIEVLVAGTGFAAAAGHGSVLQQVELQSGGFRLTWTRPGRTVQPAHTQV